MKVIPIFDKQYPIDRKKEAMKVLSAVLSGKCDTCKYLELCEKCGDEPFPADAPCMIAN